jgi:hypothetical protein
MFAYLPLIKAVTQIAAGVGVSKIVEDIVKNNVTISTTAQAVVVKAGSLVLGSMLWEQSSNHIERQTDNFVALITKHNNDSTDEQ